MFINFTSSGSHVAKMPQVTIVDNDALSTSCRLEKASLERCLDAIGSFPVMRAPVNKIDSPMPTVYEHDTGRAHAQTRVKASLRSMPSWVTTSFSKSPSYCSLSAAMAAPFRATL